MTARRTIEGQTGVLLVGHGTREPQGVREFYSMTELIAQRLPETPVQGGLLELAEPTLDEALERLVRQQVRQVVVLPLLLFAAGHVKQDIPRAIERAAASHPRLQCIHAAQLGDHPAVLKASVQRFREAIQSAVAPTPCHDTHVVLIGRGSSDADAIAEMRRFAEQFRAQTEVPSLETAFLAIASPTVDQAVARAALMNRRHIVLQPHLLFFGQLMDGLREQLHQAGEAWPKQEWFLAEYLGPCGLVAEAAVDRFRQALRAAKVPEANRQLPSDFS